MIFRPLRWLLRIAVVRRFMPGDDDDRDQWPQRSPLNAARPSNRWEDRREEMREDTRAAQQGLGALSARKRLALIGLALAALLVIIGVIAIEAQLASRPSTSQGPGAKTQATPTATATPLPTAKPTFNATPVNLSVLGWSKRTPSWAERITTAPSAPSTVYACGGVGGQNGWTINVAVSQDSGHSWTTLATGVQGAHCYLLAVSPTAPKAVAFHASTCPAACGIDQQISAYTLDGGAHWSPISPPCGCAQQPDDGFAIGWVGTTLFAIPGVTSPPRPGNEFLAKSTNGGPFTWLSLPVDNQPGPLFTTGDTIYAVRNSDIYKSTDLGASWTKASAAYNGNSVTPLAWAPGAAMLGINSIWQKEPGTYPLLRSTNDGATWQQEPDLPAGVQITTFEGGAEVFETPDGTVYLTATNSTTSTTGQGGVYKLAPGASQWRLLSPIPLYTAGSLRVTDVTWNASGQPLALWGLVSTAPGGDRCSRLRPVLARRVIPLCRKHFAH